MNGRRGCRCVQVDHRDVAHAIVLANAERNLTSPPHAQCEHVQDLVPLRRPLAEHLVEFAVSNQPLLEMSPVSSSVSRYLCLRARRAPDTRQLPAQASRDQALGGGKRGDIVERGCSLLFWAVEPDKLSTCPTPPEHLLLLSAELPVRGLRSAN